MGGVRRSRPTRTSALPFRGGASDSDRRDASPNCKRRGGPHEPEGKRSQGGALRSATLASAMTERPVQVRGRAFRHGQTSLPPAGQKRDDGGTGAGIWGTSVQRRNMSAVDIAWSAASVRFRLWLSLLAALYAGLNAAGNYLTVLYFGPSAQTRSSCCRQTLSSLSSSAPSRWGSSWRRHDSRIAHDARRLAGAPFRGLGRRGSELRTNPIVSAAVWSPVSGRDVVICTSAAPAFVVQIDDHRYSVADRFGCRR